MLIKVFLCYAHEDEALLNKLNAHLRPLERVGFIEIWYDRGISAGEEWEREISERLNTAHIILLLVSSDFINSEYCYGVEMRRALERHRQGEVKVVPIILRPCSWKLTPFGNLQASPKNGKPVISSNWHNLDEALCDVAISIENIVEKLRAKPSTLSSISEQSQDGHNIPATLLKYKDNDAIQDIIIDGYNVIKHNPKFQDVETKTLAAARNLLVSRLKYHYRPTTHRVIIVFDGNSTTEQITYDDNICIIFSRFSATAEDLIVRLAVEARGAGRAVIIYSE